MNDEAGGRMNPLQRDTLHAVAVAPAGAALIVGAAGPPGGIPDDAVTVTVAALRATQLVDLGYVRVRKIRVGYVAVLTDAGLGALATPDVADGEDDLWPTP
ncbi:MAG TPA: hypothetical protein VGW38_26850 [Chloroflexota bacterium]|nr:hypothetical protein [Chloroflexota bacterium]